MEGLGLNVTVVGRRRCNGFGRCPWPRVLALQLAVFEAVVVEGEVVAVFGDSALKYECGYSLSALDAAGVVDCLGAFKVGPYSE